MECGIFCLMGAIIKLEGNITMKVSQSIQTALTKSTIDWAA